MARLKDRYQQEIIPAMMERFQYKNVMEVPKLHKIVVNMGVGEAKENPKALENAVNELALVTGQKPVLTKAKKSIANVKLREGMNIGCKVTLRGERMYEFLERLIVISLPRIRDFKGIDNKFDGRGNYTLGITEQIIFPEILIDKVNKITGMNITFVTTANTDEEAFALLREFGLPFKKENK